MKISKFLPIGLSLCFTISTFAQDWAKALLDKSPRHGEWVEVKHDERTIKCFLVYPERKDKAPAVVVIHEIFGLTEWARSAADQVAENGCIAIAPDLLSGPDGKGSQTYTDIDAARKAISALPAAQVMADLDAAADYVVKLPAANGKLAVAGFCWGGGQTFLFANHRQDLSAAYVFYGPGPSNAGEAANIQCPVHGFYAESDARITSAVPKTAEIMKAGGKKFEPETYPGAGHGFMRAGEAPDASDANRKARDSAWQRWKSLLGKL